MLCAFVTPDTPPFQLVFNKLAARVTAGPYCHVETAFEGVPLRQLRDLKRSLCDDSNPRTLPADLQRCLAATSQVLSLFPPDAKDDHLATIAFHALAGQPLGCRVLSEHAEDPLYRPYDASWRVYRLDGAPENVVQANLVWSLSKVGLLYDTVGALTSPWRSATHLSDAPDPEHWFCSNLSLRFLQHLNLCSDLSMFGTTPNSLEKALAKYIPVSAESTETLQTHGGTFEIPIDQHHWDLVSSVIPYAIRAKLRVLR